MTEPVIFTTAPDWSLIMEPESLSEPESFIIPLSLIREPESTELLYPLSSPGVTVEAVHAARDKAPAAAARMRTFFIREGG